jgi:FecR-like protein
VQRREFGALIGGLVAGAALGTLPARAQNQRAQGQPAPAPADPNQITDDHIGQVATLQGNATVTRANAAPVALKVNDGIFQNDMLATGANSALGVTFDDETTFSLSANARIVIDEFVYQEGASGNSATFNIARGTVAFVASAVAKSGDMKITTPTANLGIRGTTGVVDVPDRVAGIAGESKIKLYPDADGRVGQIEVFDRQGGRLGALTQGASAFALRAGLGGRLAAVPFAIPPQEAARDRGVVQRLFASHTIGRRLAVQRRQIRGPNFRRPGGARPGGLRPGQRPGLQPNRGPGHQQPNRNLGPQPPGVQQPGGFRQKLQKLNPFKKKGPPPR